MRGHLPVAVLVAALALHLGSGAARADCGAKNEFEDVYCYAKQYIASDDARYVTGISLPVDAGSTIR